MDDETGKSLDEVAAEFADEAAKLGKTAGKVALSAALATSLSAALQEPPNTDLMNLAEPTPIVLVLEEEKEAVPPEDDVTEDDEESRRQRLRKMLKYLLVALFLIAGLLFGALKGCTACTATALLPHGDEAAQEQEQDESDPAASDVAAFI